MAESMKSRKMDYVFTQQMILETLGQSNDTFRDSNIQSQYQSFKADINNKMNGLKTRPSFSDTAVTLDIGETKLLEIPTKFFLTIVAQTEQKMILDLLIIKEKTH